MRKGDGELEQLQQDVTRRILVDYGTHIEYRKMEKGYSRTAQRKAAQTRRDLKIAGLTKKRWNGEHNQAYLDAVNIFGEGVKSKEEMERFAQSKRRSRKEFKEILKANIHRGLTSFVTLTYEDNMKDRERGLKDFKAFKRSLDFKMEYIGVIERQTRGAVHFHLIVFDHPKTFNYHYVKEKWKNGIVNVKYIKKKGLDNVDRLSNYLTKYLTKDELGINKKAYFTSRGLNRPKRITDSKIIQEMLPVLRKGEVLETSKRNNNYLGTTYFTVYSKQKQGEEKQ